MEPNNDAVRPVQTRIPSILSAADEIQPRNSLHLGHVTLEKTTVESTVLETPDTGPPASKTAVEILEVIFDYALNKFSDTKQRHGAGTSKFLSVIERFIARGTRVDMCLPAFPFKSANKTDKVLGILPDKAEEIGLQRLNNMCLRIGEIYTPGAMCTIISDGLVYNDLLSISDRDTWAYGQALRTVAVRKGFNNISFSRIRDLVDFPLPENMEEITYIANATNFRRFLFNHFGKEDIDIDYEIATNPDTKMTYLGYRRFLESDLKTIFPLGNGRSNHRYKRDVKYLAKQMLIRGYAFAGAVKHAFPNHLRLSIHQSTGEHKISLSLLDTKTGFTTPWHCCVALMASGEWLSAPMRDFQKDPTMKVVYEDGRPSHFQEIVSDVNNDRNSSNQAVGVSEVGNQDLCHDQVEASPTTSTALDDLEVKKINAIVKTLSAGNFTDENGTIINPFFRTQNPLLNPNSPSFSVVAWLQAAIRIAVRDPERPSKVVADVGYRNLSAHEVAETIDF